MTHKKLVPKFIITFLLLALGAPSCFEEKMYREQPGGGGEPLKQEVPEPEFQEPKVEYQEPTTGPEEKKQDFEFTNESLPPNLDHKASWEKWSDEGLLADEFPIISGYKIKSNLEKKVEIEPGLNGNPALFYDSFVIQQSYSEDFQDENTILGLECKAFSTEDFSNLIVAQKAKKAFFKVFRENGKKINTQPILISPGESLFVVWYMPMKQANQLLEGRGWDTFRFGKKDTTHTVLSKEKEALRYDRNSFRGIFQRNGALFCPQESLVNFEGKFQKNPAWEYFGINGTNKSGNVKNQFSAVTGISVFINSIDSLYPFSNDKFLQNREYVQNFFWHYLGMETTFPVEHYKKIFKKNTGFFTLSSVDDASGEKKHYKLPIEELKPQLRFKLAGEL